MNVNFPRRIVCLTEESVETIYDLGLEDLIVGVSSYAVRPAQVKKKPKVSVFTHAQLEKIKSLEPDLVLGFSDIQKDIAKDLIGMGLNVWVANHRSINGVLNYILTLGGMLGVGTKAQILVDDLKRKIDATYESTKNLSLRPRVYIEEWDDPQICGIQWFSELVELCGGKDVFQPQSKGILGQDRIISSNQVVYANPDIMLACWCGKKVDRESIKSREGYSKLEFVGNNRIHELDPAIFLQPGPAPIKDGIAVLQRIFATWNVI